MDIIALDSDNKSIIIDNSYMCSSLDTSLLVPDFFDYKGFSLPCYSYRGNCYFYYNIGVTYNVAFSSSDTRFYYFYRGLYFFFDLISSNSSGGYFTSSFPPSLTSLSIENVGKYIAYSYENFGRDVVIHYIAESSYDLYKFIFDYAIEHSVFLYWVFLSSIEDSFNVSSSYRYTYNYVHGTTYVLIQKLVCCYPDFAPILRNFGGIPVIDQSQNLKMICQLLGVDTNTTLDNCEAMKEYLKRIVQVLGGFSQNEPNDNLKIICDLLGVDSDPQGLSDCDLSKDYVKRISKMLGAE